MKRIAALWKPAVLAAATAVSLAFGAAQAFAAPPPADEKAAACPTYACPECGPLGGRWVPSAGRCYCCG